MLDLDRLRAFVVFARHLNFTHAARELHISQPALHAQIGKLAEELGVPLYRRVGRTLELTPDGVRVSGFGHEMMERVESFRDGLHGRRRSRPVILAAGRGAYLYLLGDAIEHFIDEAPAPLRLLTADRDGGLDAVRHGLAHLAVTTLEVTPGDVRIEPLVSVPQVLVLPDEHPLAGCASLPLDALDGMELIVPPPDRPHRQALERSLSRAGVRWRIAVEASGWQLMLHFARLGLGCVVVNGCCDIPAGMTAVELPALARQDYHLVRRDGPLPAAAERLRTLIATHCRGSL